jgi:scyllo-inositol 2-dehydrogenase (NADP+)
VLVAAPVREAKTAIYEGFALCAEIGRNRAGDQNTECDEAQSRRFSSGFHQHKGGSSQIRISHARVLRSLPEFLVTSVVTSRTEDVAQELPKARVAQSVQEVFADESVDLVIVATPNREHARLAKQALEAGKHVVVEKPFAVSSAEAREVVECAKRTGKVLSVFHNRRWDNGFLTLKRVLAEGTLGTLYQYEARYERFRPHVVGTRWREQPDKGSGVLFDLGSHLIDQAYHLFGKPNSVFCDMRAQRVGAATDDYFVILFDYGSLQVTLRAGSVVGVPGPVLQAHRDRGSFVKRGLDPQEEALKAGLSPETASSLWGVDSDIAQVCQLDTVGSMKEVECTMEPGAYHDFYRGVSKSITEGAAPSVNAADGLAVIELIEACALSTREGRRIAL